MKIRDLINIVEAVQRADLPEYVYHGTNVEALASILRDGYIDVSPPDDYDTSGITGVSFTTDIETAEKFADEALDRAWDSGFADCPHDMGVIIKVPFSKVSGKSVTWDGSAAEAEIRVPYRVPTNLIADIRYNKDAVQWGIEMLREDGEDDQADALQKLLGV